MALVLGILVANHFRGRVYKYKPPGAPSDQVFVPDNGYWAGGEQVYGTGRGGYYKDPNGDSGKPGLGDEILQLPDFVMCGSGGTLNYGGAGLWDGLFGIQKTIYNDQYQISAGAGGGWFGGGFSMLGGGGGGGSSFVLSQLGFSELTSNMKYKIINYYISKLPPEVAESMTEEEALEYIRSFFGRWYDVESNDPKTYPWLYGLNTRERSILEQEGFGIFADFRESLDGNGAVLISNPNSIIRFDKDNPEDTTGSFKNLGQQFMFTGSSQEWIVPITGTYHIIAYGACGGDRWRPEYEYLGGFGGCASGLFHFEAGTKLYIDVGGKGNPNIYQFVNGSKGFGGCTGGGSSSCVRYEKGVEESRILVAGGGGGIYASSADGTNPPPDMTQSGGIIINPPRDENGDYVEDDNKEDIDLRNMKFMVNDLSTVHVLVKSYNQLEVPDFAKLDCSIYINDGQEGELYQTIKAEGGIFTHEFQFPLNTIYPPNTPTHEVTIEAILNTNFYSIIYTKDIIVWVTTDWRLDDGTVPDNKIKICNKYDSYEFEDYIETQVLRKREITKEIEELIGIEDLYELFKESATNPEVDLSDLININDWYEKESVRLNADNTDEYNNQDVEDECSFSLVHLTYIIKDIEEYLGLDDYIEVELVKGE